MRSWVVVVALASGCAVTPKPGKTERAWCECGEYLSAYRKRAEPFRRWDKKYGMWRADTRYGLETPDGKVLVPLEYRFLTVMNEHWAYAYNGDDAPTVFYELPSGVSRKTDYIGGRHQVPVRRARLDKTTENDPFFFVANERPDGRFDAVFTDQRGNELRRIPDVGGPSVKLVEYEYKALQAVNNAGTFLVVHSTTKSGDAVSRFYDFGGAPISPVLPRVVHKPFKRSTKSVSYHEYPAFAEAAELSEWVIPVGKHGDQGLPDPFIYQVVDAQAVPLPLPDGVAGMSPLSWTKDGTHSAWILIYPTASGRQYAVGKGTALEVIAMADTLPRFKRIVSIRLHERVNNKITDQVPYLAWHRLDTGSWEMVITDSLAPRFVPDPGTVFATYEEMAAKWNAGYQAQLQADAQAKLDAVAAAAAARKAEEDARAEAERVRKALEDRFWSAMAVGDVASARKYVSYARKGGYEALFAKHGAATRAEFLAGRATGTVSAKVLDQANKWKWEDARDAKVAADRRRREEEIRAIEAQTKWERENGYPMTSSQESVWAQAFKNYRHDFSGYDRALQQQRDVYRRNVEAYNRGAQSWTSANPDAP